MGQAIVEAKGLRKTFSGSEGAIVALDDVSLNVNRGEVLAFLGPNGAGKTTTIKIITGLVEQDSGTVLIDGRDPVRGAGALEAVGTVLEGNRNLYWRLTALENMEYFAALKGIRRREAKLRSFELLDKFGLSAKERAPVQTLSRGMQQKVAISVALVHRPALLLLDEPTLGLDVEAAQEVVRLIRGIADEGCGVLLTTHQLDVAEALSDRTSIIRDGRILVEEPTKEIIRRFSGESYTITVNAAPSLQQIQAAERAGAFVFGDRIAFRGAPEDIYSVLDALKPLPIIKIEKDEASLTDVFLRIMRETAEKENVSNVNPVFSRVQA